jgi:hypothetical protein
VRRRGTVLLGRAPRNASTAPLPANRKRVTTGTAAADSPRTRRPKTSSAHRPPPD